ncbi:MAG: hypothetical protein IPJ21_19190 [Sterolibacteriaceae bacterium]|nr:hypothetical protein [Sterolibacteriaceae bacterium]MBK9085861.1 hypothetical protein [Sterolibacteriaceae bacterium]
MLDTAADDITILNAWPDCAPSSLDAADLPDLRAKLRQLSELPPGDPSYARLLGLLDRQIHDRLLRLRPSLRRAALPLSREARSRSVEMSDALGQLAECHLRLLRVMPAPDVARDGLQAVYRRFEVCVLAGTTVPPKLWLRASEMHRALTRCAAGNANVPGPARDGRLIYTRLLALGCVSPEHLSAQEIGDTIDWLEAAEIPVVLHDDRPREADESWFWVELKHDRGPQQFARRLPPSRPGVMVFSLAPLASHALANATQLAPLPEEADSGDGEAASLAALLRRIADQFSGSHKRKLNRRSSSYRVKVCTGLPDICRLIDPTCAEPPELSDWMVINESAGGFAIMHVSGFIEGIVSGGVIALRAEADESWTICLVRWSRSDNPEHVELGLQILSNGAQAVDIAFRHGASNPVRTVRHALLLPALPALRPKFAILAPAGSYTARRFVLVAQTSHVYITQGRLISLDLRTATVELFQFDLDPYPI